VANRFSIGDKVLASRLENGENHEPAVVVDAYEILIGSTNKPMVVVEFEDLAHLYMSATPPNVLPAPVEKEDAAEGEAEEDGTAEGEVEAAASEAGEEAEGAEPAEPPGDAEATNGDVGPTAAHDPDR
jgi:hypothetical protein